MHVEDVSSVSAVADWKEISHRRRQVRYLGEWAISGRLNLFVACYLYCLASRPETLAIHKGQAKCPVATEDTSFVAARDPDLSLNAG